MLSSASPSRPLACQADAAHGAATAPIAEKNVGSMWGGTRRVGEVVRDMRSSGGDSPTFGLSAVD